MMDSPERASEEIKFLQEACRSSAYMYAAGKSIQCSECQIWIYTQER